jgi:hypothetical protein
MSMKSESDQMWVDAAVEMIHATPPEDRSHSAQSGEFAGQAWPQEGRRENMMMSRFSRV